MTILRTLVVTLVAISNNIELGSQFDNNPDYPGAPMFLVDSPSDKHSTSSGHPTSVGNPTSTRNSAPVGHSTPVRNFAPAGHSNGDDHSTSSGNSISVQHATYFRHSTSVRNSTAVEHSTPVGNSTPARHSFSVEHSTSVQHFPPAKNSSHVGCSTPFGHTTSLEPFNSAENSTPVAHPTSVKYSDSVGHSPSVVNSTLVEYPTPVRHPAHLRHSTSDGQLVIIPHSGSPVHIGPYPSLLSSLSTSSDVGLAYTNSNLPRGLYTRIPGENNFTPIPVNIKHRILLSLSDLYTLGILEVLRHRYRGLYAIYRGTYCRVTIPPGSNLPARAELMHQREVDELHDFRQFELSTKKRNSPTSAAEAIKRRQ